MEGAIYPLHSYMKIKKSKGGIKRNAAAFVRSAKRKESNKLKSNRHFWTPEIVNQRLPTEVDWLLQGSSIDVALKRNQISERVNLWKENYLRAIRDVQDRHADVISAETQDKLDELYWDIAKMSSKDYLTALQEHPEELSIESVYIASEQDGTFLRLFERWGKFI